jgi:hypothetical protein
VERETTDERIEISRTSAPKWRKGRRDSLKNCWGATPVSVRIRPSAPEHDMVPGCVAVAQRTLDPLAQVRILARQPANVKTRTNTLKLFDDGFYHSDLTEESEPFAIAQDGKIGNPDAQN